MYALSEEKAKGLFVAGEYPVVTNYDIDAIKYTLYSKMCINYFVGIRDELIRQKELFGDTIDRQGWFEYNSNVSTDITYNHHIKELEKKLCIKTKNDNESAD